MSRKKSEPIDTELVALLVGPMGQPIKMVAARLGVSEYRINKEIKDKGLEKFSGSAADTIIERAFTGRLSTGEYLKQKKLAGILFEIAPDVRFWSSFSFKNYKYTCLSYFNTGFRKNLERQYEAFESTVNLTSTEDAMIILKKLFPDKDFTKSNNVSYIADASALYSHFPDKQFWENFDLLAAFPDYKIGSLKYFLAEFAIKNIRTHYNRFKFSPPTVERVELEENKVEDDVEVKTRIKSTIDFLNS